MVLGLRICQKSFTTLMSHGLRVIYFTELNNNILTKVNCFRTIKSVPFAWMNKIVAQANLCRVQIPHAWPLYQMPL